MKRYLTNEIILTGVVGARFARNGEVTDRNSNQFVFFFISLTPHELCMIEKVMS